MRKILSVIFICLSAIVVGQEKDTISNYFNKKAFKPRVGLLYL